MAIPQGWNQKLIACMLPDVLAAIQLCRTRPKRMGPRQPRNCARCRPWGAVGPPSGAVPGEAGRSQKSKVTLVNQRTCLEWRLGDRGIDDA
eukprot:gene26257-17358_t